MKRQPTGIPTGGQFAASARSEADAPAPKPAGSISPDEVIEDLGGSKAAVLLASISQDHVRSPRGVIVGKTAIDDRPFAAHVDERGRLSLSNRSFDDRPNFDDGGSPLYEDDEDYVDGEDDYDSDELVQVTIDPDAKKAAIQYGYGSTFDQPDEEYVEFDFDPQDAESVRSFVTENYDRVPGAGQKIAPRDLGEHDFV